MALASVRPGPHDRLLPGVPGFANGSQDVLRRKKPGNAR